MRIEHKLYGNRVFKYGYIWWTSDKDKIFKKFFPQNRFTIEISGKKLRNRKVEWKYRRVLIGYKNLEVFKENDRIFLTKNKNEPNLIKIIK
jgi:hypothetical protein